MSDQLPSRDPRTKQGRSLAFDHAQFAALGNAWRSGRLVDRVTLVDRKAFDYETTTYRLSCTAEPNGHVETHYSECFVPIVTDDGNIPQLERADWTDAVPESETPMSELERLKRLMEKQSFRLYWYKFTLALSEWRHGYRPWRHTR